jgi:hypothetical protein
MHFPRRGRIVERDHRQSWEQRVVTVSFGETALHAAPPGGPANRVRIRGCRFIQAESVWTLEADCTITRTLELPPGVSLDGNGKTIALAGNAERFHSVAIRVSGATVRNLTIDGSGLEATCPGYVAALVVSGPGRIEHTTVSNVRFGAGCARGVGIEVGVFDGARVDLVGVTVAQVAGAGILLAGEGAVTISDSTIRDAAVGVQAMNAVGANISGLAMERVSSGIFVADRAEASIQGSVLSASTEDVGVTDHGVATIGNLSIVRFGRPDEASRNGQRRDPLSLGATLSRIVATADGEMRTVPNTGSP